MAIDASKFRKGLNIATGAAGLLTSTIQKGAAMADVPEENIQEEIDDLSSTTADAGSYRDLLNKFNNMNWARTNYNMWDLTGMSGGEAAGKIALDSLTGAMSGAEFGTNIMPGIGTAIGAVVGGAADAISSGFGWLSKKVGAHNNAQKYNYEGRIANELALNTMQDNAINIGKDVHNQALYNRAAFGGPLYINDFFTNGVRKIENGGRHSENPLGGVPMGIAADGLENLVEEGELIYNDYVFSQRLKVPEASKAILGLSKKKDYTFAEAADELQKESEERPNDPISKRTLDEMMGRLQESQETVKAKKEARRLRAAYNKLSPLDKMNLAMAMQQPQEGQMADGGTLSGWPLPYPTGSLYSAVRFNMLPLEKQYELSGFGPIWLDRMTDPDAHTTAQFGYKNGGQLAHKHAGLFSKSYLDSFVPGVQYNGYNWADRYEEQEAAARMQSIKDWANSNKIITNPGSIPTTFQTAQESKTPTYQDVDIQKLIDAIKRNNDERMPETREAIATESEDIDNNRIQGNPFAQSLRAASVFGSLAGAIGSLFDKPNYSNIERAEKAMAAVPRVSAGHVGQRLTYNPVDINYLMTQTANQGLGARRALVESGAGPQAIIAGNYGTQTAMGQNLLAALAQNEARKAQVAEFNRGTDTTNVGNDLQSALANQRRDMMGANFLLETAPMRNAELATLQNQRSAQVINAFNQLHNLGTDMMNRDMVAANVASGTYGVMNDIMKGLASGTLKLTNTGANGGKLNTKKGGKHA